MHVGPFERHIREAVELNRQRAPLYAQASAGVSLPISRQLVRRERMLIPLARCLDLLAARYHRAGIPIMDELFVSMSGAPSFIARIPAVPPAHPSPAPRALARSLRRAFAKEGYPAVAKLIDRELERLAADPGYWCMLRHVLESSRRVCFTATPHADEARRAGLPSPGWIHRLLLHLHLLALSSAARLDARAMPLQREGLPILCRDLPPIPPRP